MKRVFFLFLSLCIIACSSQNESAPLQSLSYQDSQSSSGDGKQHFEQVEQTIEIAHSKASSAVTMQTPSIQRKIIKTADYKFQVKDLDESTLRVQRLAEQHGAFISNMNLNSSATMNNNVLTLRVPNKSFDPLLEAITKESIFTNHKRINSKDVTEQYVDLTSRLKTKKEVKEKYERILRQDAKSLSQILNAEEKIRVLQEEIEAKEGKLRYYNDRIDLSEIKLEIYQEVEYQDKLFIQNKSFAEKSKDSFLHGWSGVQSLLLATLNIWPILFLGGLVIWNRRVFYNFLGRGRK